MKSSELKAKLEQILQIKTIRGYTKNLDPIIHSELISLFGDRPIPELFFLGLNPTALDTCEHGNKYLFKNVNEGYRNSCGAAKDCICRRTAQAEKVSKTLADKSDADKKEATKRYKQTMLDRYGVDNPSKVATFEEKRKATNLDRYGHVVPSQNESTLDAIEKKTGYRYALQNPDIREKAKQTHIQEYGGLMTHARNAAYDKYGMNPFAAQAVKDKIKATLKVDYGRDHIKRLHVSDETISIIQDADKFSSFMKDKSLRLAALELGIHPPTVSRLASKYDVTVHYEQSYEEANISKFINELGFSTVCNSKKIIPPLQLDVYVPEKSIAIEYCGLYWHSELRKGDDQHNYVCRS